MAKRVRGFATDSEREDWLEAELKIAAYDAGE